MVNELNGGSSGNAARGQPAEASIETAAVWAAEVENRVNGAAVFPVYMSSTFSYRGEKGYRDVRYLRCNNCPNNIVLAEKFAALEGTEAAVVTSSGMAAITTTLLTFLAPGDHLMTADALYGGTYDFTKQDLKTLGISVSRVDMQRPESWEAMVRPETKIFYVEVLTNPLVELGDLEAVVKFSQRHKLLSIIDSTFATPVLCRPVKDWGFDIVLHSATKYLNGHSDLVAGVVAGSQILIDKVIDKLNHLGGSLDPHACFLLQRGLKTLALRVNQHCKNALAVCEFLERQPEVSQVNYPALKSSPQYERVQQLLGGRAGGLFSFELAAGVEAADIFLDSLKFAMNAPSLGSVETLITRPSCTSHAGLTEAELKVLLTNTGLQLSSTLASRLSSSKSKFLQAAGISEGLIRVAIGIEGTEDLLADFAQGLKKACGTAKPPC